MHYMHYKDYIHHDFYVYSPVLLTQYLGHCSHTPCTELYILRIRCITSSNNRLGCWENPPSPATGGGNHLAGGEGGCGGPCSYIYMVGTSNQTFPVAWPVTHLKSAGRVTWRWTTGLDINSHWTEPSAKLGAMGLWVETMTSNWMIDRLKIG